MLSKEQTEMLEQAIFLLFRLRDEQSQENWELTRAREFDRAFHFKEVREEKESDEGHDNLYFSKKEIKEMPKEIRESFKNQKNIRFREDTGIYEIRKRIDGVDYFASSKNRVTAVRKFIDKLRARPSIQPKEESKEIPHDLPVFSNVCWDWLELKQPSIKQRTYNYYVQVFEAHILPFFRDVKIGDIKQSDIQRLINEYVSREKYRTATKIYQTLSAVFNYAVGEDLIERSPMRKLRPPKYEEKTGIALTVAEEREFVGLLTASKCDENIKNALLFLLYTGARRSELAAARIEGDFISLICAKTRKEFRERRRLIPITPMLARYLRAMDLSKLNNIRPDALTQAFKRLMPAHHLHELRHTFITRCQECGVAREVVSVWAGHAADNTQTSNVYTHFSPEFMKAQALKVDYNI